MIDRGIDVETHRAVFTWVQQRLAAAGLLQGRTIAIDATTLDANAAMRSIVRRDTGEDYQAYLTRLAAASGIKTPTREVLARFDRRRKKKTAVGAIGPTRRTRRAAALTVVIAVWARINAIWGVGDPRSAHRSPWSSSRHRFERLPVAS